MIKFSLTTLTAIFLLCVTSFAQDTVWFDSHWKLSTPAAGTYFGTREKTDSGWVMRNHYRNGTLQVTGRFLDEAGKISDGVWNWYNEDGVINRSQTYTAGKVTGLERLYYKDGAVKMEGPNMDGKRDGEWSVFFPSGKLAGKAVYQAGKPGRATLYNEDGSVNPNDSVLFRDASFPGGPSKFLYFLNRHLRYPDYAVQHRIMGTVIVLIHLSKEGKVMDLKIQRSADGDLDAEALRVMRLSPNWEPAMIAGVPMESYQLQPVIFRF